MTDAHYILPDLGEGFITVIVGAGDKRKTFSLHKNIVCNRSDFFRSSLSGDWKEAISRKVELPEDDPDIFRVYIQSLYVSKDPPCLREAKVTKMQVSNVQQVPEEELSEDSFRVLSQAYVLADKMLDVHGKNHVVAAIYHRLKNSFIPHNQDVCDGLAEMITAVWNVTSEGASVRSLLSTSIIKFRTHIWTSSADLNSQLDKVAASLAKAPPGFLSVVIAALIKDVNQGASRVGSFQLRLSDFMEAIG